MIDPITQIDLLEFLEEMAEHKRSIKITYQTEGRNPQQKQKSFEYFEYDDTYLYHVHYNARHPYKLQNIVQWAEWIRPRRWRVYVIELDADPNYVYVGETTHPPELRLRQHNTGAYSAGSGRVFIRGARGTLRPDLYAHIPSVFSKEDALALETQIAADLEAAEYRVEGGH